MRGTQHTTTVLLIPSPSCHFYVLESSYDVAARRANTKLTYAEELRQQMEVRAIRIYKTILSWAALGISSLVSRGASREAPRKVHRRNTRVYKETAKGTILVFWKEYTLTH